MRLPRGTKTLCLARPTVKQIGRTLILKLDSDGRNGFVKVANKLLDNNSRSLHRGLPLKAIQEFGQNSIFLYGPPIERSRRAHSNPLLTAILCLILHEACIEVVY